MKCGMGNWSDVATQFVPGKSETQCEELYLGYLYRRAGERDDSDCAHSEVGAAELSYEHVLLERDFTGGSAHQLDAGAVHKCEESIAAHNE